LFNPPIPLSRPLLPTLAAYQQRLQDVWAKHWLTNRGDQVCELSQVLQNRLGASHVSLFCNGSLALLLGLKALELEGEVITTPFTFAATTHALHWAGLQPVFADISPDTLTLDPAAVEAAITPRTSAILGVHVFGIPCHVAALADIAARHKLKVIYDAAHAFGVEIAEQPISAFGDMSMFSLHATKLFHTAEGGLLTYKDAKLEKQLHLLQNHGISGEDTVELAGTNAKMNELQAAMGLCVLELVEEERKKRKKLVAAYAEALSAMPGVQMVLPGVEVTPSYQYVPILFSSDAALSRDVATARLRSLGIHARRYFRPLLSAVCPYDALPSSIPSNLPCSRRTVENILCLPLWGGMPDNLPEVIAKAIGS